MKHQQGRTLGVSIPIVFIHQGDDKFLHYSIKQAQTSNPKSQVMLLGDNANRMITPDHVHHYNIDDYREGAIAFASLYQHQSVNSYEYELFCFQRWFILRDFARANQLTDFCYLDSDIMLYTNIDTLEYQAFTFTCTWFSVNTLQVLEQFCQLINDYYQDSSLFEQLIHYTGIIGDSSVSDMVFSRLYLEHYPEGYNSLAQETIDSYYYYGIYKGTLLDGNINLPYNHYSPDFPPEHSPIEMSSGRKKVYLINGRPFCKLLTSDVYLKISFLHFQGPDNKRYIKNFVIPNAYINSRQQLHFDYDLCQWIAHRRSEMR